MNPDIKETPWDKAVFAMNTFEILKISEETLQQASKNPGHYTVKADPLFPKKILHKYGFYYCDTLIEPFCAKEKFRFFQKEGVSLSKSTDISELLEICHGAFSHGRFHRDFNLDRSLCDFRYDNWLAERHAKGKVYGLLYKEELAGFIAFSGNALVLHAIAKKFQGKNLGKYLWSPACRALFDAGFAEIRSSISAANLPALNLYASLGFGFRNAVDAYHLLVK